MASDGKMKLKSMLPTHISLESHSENLQNIGLIRILDYTCSTIPNRPHKALIVMKCEVVYPVLEMEINNDPKGEESGVIKKEEIDTVKREQTGIVLKLKQE